MFLNPNDYIRGKAGTANAVSFAIFGRNATGHTALANPVAQGLLGATTRTLYISDRDLVVETIQLVNTSGSAVSGVILYLNGGNASNQINGAFTIPANGTFTYSNGVWNVDTNTTIFTGVGTNQITVSATAPTNPQVNDLWVDIS